MARKSFSAKITHMWWTVQKQPAPMCPEQAQQALAQLSVHSHRGWQRMVCNNWLGAPITGVDQVFRIERELRCMGYEHFFISRRGITDAAYGVQVWSAEPELSFVVHLYASPIINVRCYTPDQFEDQVRTMLSWRMF